MIITGGFHTLAIVNNQIFAWGHNTFGQLMIGKDDNQNTPQSVDFFADKKIRQLACGHNHTLVIADDQLYACGSGYYGQLGTGNNREQHTPRLVKFFAGKYIKQLICGNNHVFAIMDDPNEIGSGSSIYAWGRNDHGQLGLGNNYHEHTPQLIEFFVDKNVRQLVCGANYSFAIADNLNSNLNGLGCHVYAWGNNNRGELGIGCHDDQNVPQLVEFFVDKKIEQLACGANSAFAIVDGHIYAWGGNNYGDQNIPQLLEFFADKKIERLFCGNSHILAIVSERLQSQLQLQQTSEGCSFHSQSDTNQILPSRCICYPLQVYAWGYNNNGQLGIGNYNNQHVPQLVEFFADKNIRQLVCGDFYTLAVADDRVYAWGDNEDGALGIDDESESEPNTPQLVKFFEENPFFEYQVRVKSARKR